MTDNAHSDRIDNLREGTITLIESLTEQARAYELPEPPPALEAYYEKLAENTYRVLVVGEAKRGKSSFINALIGRSVLPTDVDIATSQVFRVSPADHAAYRLRFEDGSEREITAADLPRYGSQVVEDAEGLPRMDQIIRWIEVDIPIRYLPAGVSMLDTPGLGSLYAAHAQITQRYVPLADAVIFVLDSGQPIIQAEIDFIESILAVTGDIFFIQTKTDQYDESSWQEVRARNEKILAERFKDRLTNARIWPVSSNLLLKAATTGDEDYLIVSGQAELAAALREFLFRVAGWSRAAKALLLADHCLDTGRQTLLGRQAQLADGDAADQAERQRLAQQRLQEFEADWGTGGRMRQRLTSSVDRVVAVGKQDLTEALQEGAKIHADEVAKIDAIDSEDTAKQLADVMPGDILAAAVATWRQITQECRTECLALVRPFVEAAEAVALPSESGMPEMAASQGMEVKIKDDWRTIFGRAGRESTMVSAVAEVVLSLFVDDDRAATAAADTCAAMWGVVASWRHRGELRIQSAKEQLRASLATILQRVQQQFLHTELAYGAMSFVDHHFESLVQAMDEQIRDLAERKLAEARAEIARGEEAALMDDAQRRARADEVADQMGQWDVMTRRMAAILDDLRALQHGSEVPSEMAS